MQLSYRGNSYQTETSLLEIRETDIAGKYRGHQWKHRLPKHIPQLQPKFDLQYRGIAYVSCPQVQVSLDSFQCDCVPKANKLAKSSVRSLEQIHLENLRKNLARRLESAKMSDNDLLVKMLERECQALNLA